MAGLSLREAGRETGRSKSAILRAIQAGKLSASRDETGAWSVDPSELFRVYAPCARSPAQPIASATAGQDAAAAEAPIAPLRSAVDAEVRALRERLAEMHELREEDRRREAELKAEHRQREAELKAERLAWQEQAKSWQEQAERLLLATPKGPAASVPSIAARRSWWPFRRSA